MSTDLGREPVNTAAPSSGQPPLVLLVEDDDVLSLLMTHTLQQAGWQVRRAIDGRDGFELACFGARRPDLVIMDVALPGMSGIQATRFLRDYEQRRGLPPVPILGCSGLDRAETQQAMRRAGMDQVVQKPLSMAGLLAAVDALLAT
jgi:DNA-binding response OmpR family regulator